MNTLKSLILILLTTITITAQEGFFETPDKVKIFYKIEGKGADTLVVVHGGPGNSLESIRPDMQPLAKNRRVIYYDQRGQGKSDLVKDGTRLGYKNHVADLEALRVHFKLDKISLLGNSWGGLLISLYAIEHPDRVERLVLDVPAAPMSDLLQDMEDELSRRLAILYKPDRVRQIRNAMTEDKWVKAKDILTHCRETFYAILAAYTHELRPLDKIGYKGDLCAGGVESVRYQRTANAHAWRSLGQFNIVAQLAAVKAPVLVIHGASDVVRPRGSELYASAYPNARLLTIPNAGHLAHIESPDIFYSAIETFLNGN
ncbi:MAG TPA: alpha/beta hydrolase [Pyrinomonadaceae bacterium]|nr:alpha/beta hydrolase [Pyrinomonadaceae bacterium]